MADVSPVAELLGQALYHYERLRPLLPTYGHLLVSALFPIWIGAHASLTRPSSAAKPPKKKDNKHNDDYDTEDEEGHGPLQKMEGLEPSDALIFPLTAGLTLGGLYLVIKWLEDPAILNKILGFYFSQMGLFFAFAFLKDVLLMIRSFVFPRYYRQGGRLWKAKQSERLFITSEKTNSANSPAIRHSPLPGFLGRVPLPGTVLRLLWRCRNLSYQRLKVRAYIRGLFDLKCLIGLLDITSGILALSAVAYFAFVANPWWLTNFLGFCFCYGTLQFMSPSTFWTGTLILGSLFFYDIYFVFFTPLMVTVATKLDVPIKLLFPRPVTSRDAPGSVPLAMLGLGDIVIPGMMIGLALRFDLFLYYQRKGAQLPHTEAQDQATVKPEYQSATGAWGERFWAPTIKPIRPELQPPYHDARAFPKTYFKASIIGYVFGMVTTLLAMQYSNHAQPALLYLVPGVLISLWGTALIRGETSTMWEFSDAEEEEDDKEKEDEDEVKDKTSNGDQKSLLMRLFSGESMHTPKSEDTAQAKKAEGEAADDSKSDAKSSEKEEGRVETKNPKKSRDNSELVSFSISVPRKPSEAEDSLPKPSYTEDEEVRVSRDRNRDDEPPLKRRRRSVMNKNSTT
ncbi:Peptidase A22B signal peptide peptidase [Penicillium bovifimosum]|uniref:Peptidase A22B signal peptide peptidase n=1 Tax=Penicillium bovifimosum TaxID=126998 RepID=A0A9W9L803_9EURO|nr:Peptidase A22B signal peptide peptidase [Penicillium bovifimosum]KAJ5143550.1 Peptidase A22B signal peptide peptidase [Penicillium bovifimosum]